MPGFFEGRQLVIATMHQKEQVLKPLLEADLKVKVIVANGLNTDLLGTFSGEVARTSDPLTTARKKCELALELTGCDLALASEGSFGAHPSAFFLPANEEWLLLMDRKHQLEIHAHHLSLETNFSGQEFSNMEELDAFASKVGFPSHGLILRRSKDHLEGILKGISDPEQLRTAAQRLIETQGSGFVETDMRAMLNPTRMAVIQEAGEKLLRKINSRCPACGFPGFDVVSLESGLPCSLCGRPTASIKAQHLGCAHCQHKEVVPHPQGKSSEDPMYCDHCNP
ncbi:MAG: hypothetical protein EB038_02005 [Cyclobacteriaceae bacterium]|nr:hypothetical protein [Cyclobacteriaceae bacterium]